MNTLCNQVLLLRFKNADGDKGSFTFFTATGTVKQVQSKGWLIEAAEKHVSSSGGDHSPVLDLCIKTVLSFSVFVCVFVL